MYLVTGMVKFQVFSGGVQIWHGEDADFCKEIRSNRFKQHQVLDKQLAAVALYGPDCGLLNALADHFRDEKDNWNSENLLFMEN